MKTCPRCGSVKIEAAGFDAFACGTFETSQGPRFTKNCRLIWETGNRFNAEVERLTKERDALQARLQGLEKMFSYAVNGASNAFDSAGIQAGEFVDRAKFAAEKIKRLKTAGDAIWHFFRNAPRGFFEYAAKASEVEREWNAAKGDQP